MARRVTTKLSGLHEAINEALEAYGEQILDSVSESIEQGANLFIAEAVKVSPEDKTHSGNHYKDCWAIAPTKYTKYRRYVGNTKKVPGKNSSSIPLINILEFSTTRGHPHVNEAVKNSKDQIYNLVKSKLEKVGNNA